MRNIFFRLTASFLTAALIITGTPVSAYALEGDILTEDTLVSGEAGDNYVSSGDEVTGTDTGSDKTGLGSDTEFSVEQTDEFVDDTAVAPDEEIVYVGEDESDFDNNEEDEEIISLSEDSIDEESTGEEPFYIPEEALNYKDIGLEVEESDIGYEDSLSGKKRGLFSLDKADGIPSSYRTDASYLPEVKNQRPFGLCWAFSSMASCEVSLIKKYGLDPASVDTSERALCYFLYNLKGINDPQGNTLNDYQTVVLKSDPNIYQIGGNVPISSLFLANWGCPVDEAKAPYSELSTINSGNLTTDTKKGDDALDDSLCYDPCYHVQNIRFINANDTDGIKKAIMDNGIVSRSYYHSDSYLKSNSADHIYAYNSGSTHSGTTNHAITLIGWDDNFSKDNFIRTPQNDGAWLVRNSWGSSTLDGGYMWISYEDKSLSEVTLISCESKDNYDNNYFYDGTAGLKTIAGRGKNDNGGGTAFNAANVFKAKTDEVLKAVSFMMYTTDVPYSVQIYKNLTNPSNPSSGTAMLKEEVTGVTSYSGYYTVPLGTSIPLTAGDTFSVVFTFGDEENRDIKLYTEKNDTGANYDWLKMNADIKQGQSFYKRAEGTAWRDVYSDKTCFRIHAYTDKDESKDYLNYYFVENNGSSDVSKTLVKDAVEPVTVRKGAGLSYFIEDNTPGRDISLISSNPDLLTVGDAVDNGTTRRIEIIPKDRGDVTLTIKLGSNTTISKDLSLRIYDRSVIPGKTALEINTAMDDKYDTLDLENRYVKKIESVTIEASDPFITEYTGNTGDTSGTLRVRYTGSPVEKTVTATLKIKYQGEADLVSKQIKIVLKKVKPVLTVTQTAKVDQLYSPDNGMGELRVKVSTGRIKNVTLVDSGRNGMTSGVPNVFAYEAGASDIAADGLTANVKIKAKAGGTARFTRGRLLVYLDGYTEPLAREMAIQYTTGTIRPTLTSTSVLTSGDKIMVGNRIEIGVKNVTGNREETFDSPTIQVTDKNGTSLAAKYVPSYSQGLIILTPKTEEDLTVRGEAIFVKVTDTLHAQPFTINNFRVNAINTSSMTLALAKPSQTMNYWEGDAAVNKAVTISTPLNIRKCTGLNDYIKSGLIIEGADVKSKDAISTGKLQVLYDPASGLVKASFPSGNPPAAGAYRYKMTLKKEYTGGKRDISATLTLSVRKLDKTRAAAARAIATGRFDVLDRDGVINYKPTFNNLPAAYEVTKVELAGDDADKFTIAGTTKEGITGVSLNPTASFNTTTRYGLALKYTIKMGEASFVSTTPVMNTMVSQGKVTFKVPGADTYGPGAGSEDIAVKAYNAKGEEIVVSSIALKNPASGFSLTDHGDGTYSLKYDPPANPARAYTPRFSVTLKDRAVNTSIPTCTGNRITIR